MPRVPRYVQQRLASSVVGTPGVDNSAAQALGQVATGLGQITQTAGILAAQNFAVEERQRLAAIREQQKLADRQRQLTNNTLKASHQLRIDSGLRALGEEVKTNVPFGAATKSYTEQARKYVSDYALTIDDPELKQEIVASSLTGLRSKVAAFDSDVQSLRAKQAYSELSKSFEEFSISGGGYTDPNELLKALNKFGDDSADAALAAFGNSAASKISDAQEGAVLNYLSKAYRENPEGIEVLLDSKVFDEFIPETRKTKIYNDYQRYAKTELRIRQAEEQRAAQVRYVESNVGVKEDPTLEGYDALIEEARLGVANGTLSPDTVTSAANQKLAYERNLARELEKEARKGGKGSDAEFKRKEAAKEVKFQSQMKATKRDLTSMAGTKAGEMALLKGIQNGTLTNSKLVSLRSKAELLSLVEGRNGLTPNQYSAVKSHLDMAFELLNRNTPPAQKVYLKSKLGIAASIRAWTEKNVPNAPARFKTQTQQRNWRDQIEQKIGTTALNKFYSASKNAERKVGRNLSRKELQSLLNRAVTDTRQEIMKDVR